MVILLISGKASQRRETWRITVCRLSKNILRKEGDETCSRQNLPFSAIQKEAY